MPAFVGDAQGETHGALLHLKGSTAAIRHACWRILLSHRNRKDKETHTSWEKTRILLKASDRKTGKREIEMHSKRG